MRFPSFEFDDSVDEETINALSRIEPCSYNPTNFFVGDHVRIYPKGSSEGQIFKCIARRHEMYPDENGNSKLVFVLGSI